MLADESLPSGGIAEASGGGMLDSGTGAVFPNSFEQLMHHVQAIQQSQQRVTECLARAAAISPQVNAAIASPATSQKRGDDDSKRMELILPALQRLRASKNKLELGLKSVEESRVQKDAFRTAICAEFHSIETELMRYGANPDNDGGLEETGSQPTSRSPSKISGGDALVYSNPSDSPSVPISGIASAPGSIRVAHAIQGDRATATPEPYGGMVHTPPRQSASFKYSRSPSNVSVGGIAVYVAPSDSPAPPISGIASAPGSIHVAQGSVSEEAAATHELYGGMVQRPSRQFASFGSSRYSSNPSGCGPGVYSGPSDSPGPPISGIASAPGSIQVAQGFGSDEATAAAHGANGALAQTPPRRWWLSSPRPEDCREVGGA